MYDKGGFSKSGRVIVGLLKNVCWSAKGTGLNGFVVSHLICSLCVSYSISPVRKPKLTLTSQTTLRFR